MTIKNTLILYTVVLSCLRILQIKIDLPVALLSLVLHWCPSCYISTFLIFSITLVSNHLVFYSWSVILTFWHVNEKLWIHCANSLDGFECRVLWRFCILRVRVCSRKKTSDILFLTINTFWYVIILMCLMQICHKIK